MKNFLFKDGTGDCFQILKKDYEYWNNYIICEPWKYNRLPRS